MLALLQTVKARLPHCGSLSKPKTTSSNTFALITAHWHLHQDLQDLLCHPLLLLHYQLLTPLRRLTSLLIMRHCQWKVLINGRSFLLSSVRVLQLVIQFGAGEVGAQDSQTLKASS